MKSWADHCSSDEEDDIPKVSTLDKSNHSRHLDSDHSDNEDNNTNGNNGDDDHSSHYDSEEELQMQREKILESLQNNDPPFTAFVGNLSYEVQDAQHLAYELEEMCKHLLGHQVTAINGRLMTDRDTGKKKGFGYVEFETVEDVSLTCIFCVMFQRIFLLHL